MVAALVVGSLFEETAGKQKKKERVVEERDGRLLWLGGRKERRARSG